MPSFLTQCPHCLTSFRVTDAQLEAAEGLVRCGACLGIFSAAANRITLKQSPEEAAAAAQALPEDEPEAADAADEIPRDEDFVPDAPVEPEPQPEGVAAPPMEEAPAPVIDLSPVDALVDEPPATQPETAELPDTDTDPDPDLLDQDFDIPLGDLNLDADDLADDSDEEYTEDEDDEYEEDDEDEDEYDEEDVEDEYDDDVVEEYADEFEDAADTEDEEDLDDNEEVDDEEEYDDEFEADIDAAESALAAAEAETDTDDEHDEDEVQHVPVARVTADKTELRRYLAEIEDDEALEPLDDEALDAFDAEPVMLDTAPRRRGFVTAALFLGNILLAGLLLLQYANTNIDTLTRSTRFAALMPYLCGVLECPPPERSQLNRLVSEQVLVRSHPRYAQALEVNLVFRNDATVAQPFPALELSFIDTSNRLVANRLFQPAEYLQKELHTSDMPPQSSVQVTLEMVDPGSAAVNYTLAFRKP